MSASSLYPPVQPARGPSERPSDRFASAGYVVLLNGPLGAGKTCLTQGILRGLGSDDHARSPTFVLVAEYEARLTLYHVDLYRTDGPSDIEELGIEEYLWGDGVCVMEWAEKARGHLSAGAPAGGSLLHGRNEPPRRRHSPRTPLS